MRQHKVCYQRHRYRKAQQRQETGWLQRLGRARSVRSLIAKACRIGMVQEVLERRSLHPFNFIVKTFAHCRLPRRLESGPSVMFCMTMPAWPHPTNLSSILARGCLVSGSLRLLKCPLAGCSMAHVAKRRGLTSHGGKLKRVIQYYLLLWGCGYQTAAL